jgi:hypothetical protein
VVLDVAFAASSQFEKRTLPFINMLGPDLLCWVDHHEHRRMWPTYANDPRFILVPNRQARACPELITPQLVEQVEGKMPAEHLVAHADFDGALSAIKWILKGKEPWPQADEDARAVDSPGRGNTLSPHGQRFARGLDMASASYERERFFDFLLEWVGAVVDEDFPPRLDREFDKLAQSQAELEIEVAESVTKLGNAEAPGVFALRTERSQANHRRRQLLIGAETRAPVGVVVEPNANGGVLLTAATFDERLDLEDVDGLRGGRSDYRFCRIPGDGRALIQSISDYVVSVLGTEVG